MISLQSLVQRAARMNPSGTATHYLDRRQSWSTVVERLARLAGGLSQLGLDEGDRVAILSLNSDRYFEAVFGIPWAGYCMVPLNTRWALPENEYAINDSGARVVLFDDAFVEQVASLQRVCPAVLHTIYMGEGECPEWANSYEQVVSDNDPCEVSTRSGEDMVGIFYTGGTTGFPKGVMHCHRAIWASAVGTLADFGMTRDSVYLHAAPMFHMADFAGSMNALLSCSSNYILQAFEPGLVLKAIAEQGISHVLLVPAMIKMILNHRDASRTDVSSLERLLYGASPMPAAVLEQCLSIWPDIGMAQAYGQTELAPVATTLSVEAHREGGERLKSAGRPTPVSDIRIVNDEGNDCSPHESGEIAVRGPHVMLGYWNKPEETANTVREGWVFTGDAGLFDEDGYLYIVDRVKDMVVTGGENVFTTEVENAIISHDAVQDVAVIGIPHEEWGEAVHAIVILQPDCHVTGEALIAHCRNSIAGYKLPKSISFRNEPLPLSGAGKVLKTDLRKPFWGGMERQVN